MNRLLQTRGAPVQDIDAPVFDCLKLRRSPTFGGRQCIPRPCYRFSVPPAATPGVPDRSL